MTARPSFSIDRIYETAHGPRAILRGIPSRTFEAPAGLKAGDSVYIVDDRVVKA